MIGLILETVLSIDSTWELAESKYSTKTERECRIYRRAVVLD